MTFITLQNKFGWTIER